MKRNVLERCFSGVNNWEVFSITRQFEKLTISDNKGSSSSSSSSSLGINSSTLNFNRAVTSYPRRSWKNFITSGKLSELTLQLMDKTKAPFIEIPRNICDISAKSKDLILNDGFRLLPEQTTFFERELFLSKSKDKLVEFKKNLGLTLRKASHTPNAALKWNSIATILYDKCLVEAVTYNNGIYGRFIVLVQLGWGCTVWYGFIPGDPHSIPVESILFTEIQSYECFINNPEVHVQEGFDKITLYENKENIIPIISEAFNTEKPFYDIKIPPATPTLMGVLRLAFLKPVRLVTRKKRVFPPGCPHANSDNCIWVSLLRKRIPHTESTAWERVPYVDYINDRVYKDALRDYLAIAPGANTVLKRCLGTHRDYSYYVQYAIFPWKALTSSLLGSIPIRTKWIRSSPERMPGIGDILFDNSRMKSLKLKDLIKYSYKWDIRFVSVICLLIGISIWWGLSPEALFFEPKALCSPDLKLISRVLRDTYIDKVCSTHTDVISPCPCGQPLNMMVKQLFPEPQFDPLYLNKTDKGSALAVYMAYILLVIILNESISMYGILYPI